MIKTCDKCGGLYATEHMEMFGGTPCLCRQGSSWPIAMSPDCARTGGQIVASNLRACDIISERDLERAAKQIDEMFAPRPAPQPVAAPLTHEEEKRVTADFYDAQAKRNPVPAPAVSAEAKLAAETITHLFGVGHVNDIDFTIQRAIDAATEKLRAERDKYYMTVCGLLYSGLLDKATCEQIRGPGEELAATMDALRAELTLLHESHDALAKGVETLRAEKKELRYLAEKCFKYLGAQIRKRLLNETAYDGTQSLSKEIADRLDRLDRAAMTAQKGRDAS